MTKTLTTVYSYRIANLCLPEAVPLGTTVDGSFVWALVFGAWNFHKFPVLI